MRDLEKVKELSENAYYFLINFDAELYSDGRYDLGAGVYVNIEAYTTKMRKEAKYESHRKYIDVQYMISGKEIIMVEDINKLKPLTDYDSQKDIILYDNCVIGKDYYIEEGEFLIFGPQEAHMPCIRVDNNIQNRKLVIKVPIA